MTSRKSTAPAGRRSRSTKKRTKAQPSPRSTRSQRVSPAAMRQGMLAIASRHFGYCFNEMCGYYAQANPNGRSYVAQSLQAMREVLEDHERRAGLDRRRSEKARQPPTVQS